MFSYHVSKKAVPGIKESEVSQLRTPLIILIYSKKYEDFRKNS